MPGCNPSPTNVIPIGADAAATRTSHANAKHRPAPMAGPLIAAFNVKYIHKTKRDWVVGTAYVSI